jgi:hypothetical protein
MRRAAASVLNTEGGADARKGEEPGARHGRIPGSSISRGLLLQASPLSVTSLPFKQTLNGLKPQCPAVLAAAGIAAVLAGAMAAVLVVAGGVMAVLAAGGAIAVDAGAAVAAGAGAGVADSSLWPLQALRASTAASDRAQIKG